MSISFEELFRQLTPNSPEFQPVLFYAVLAVAWYVINVIFLIRIARRLGMKSIGYAFIPVFQDRVSRMLRLPEGIRQGACRHRSV